MFEEKNQVFGQDRFFAGSKETNNVRRQKQDDLVYQFNLERSKA